MIAILRLVALLYAGALIVLVWGALRPRVPGIGFAGSFVTGQYPLHAALAAVAGIGIGLGLRAAGSPIAGMSTAAVSLAATAGLVVVLVAQDRVARAEGVRIDWTSALTTVAQPDGRPDRTVEYAPGRSADLYLPTGPGPHPVLVWVHGGSWVRGDRDDRTALNRFLADRGHAVLAVDYRLPPPVPAGRDQQRDVACAIAWARANAAAHGLDADRTVLAGQSAGATLALSVASGLTDTTLGCPGTARLPVPSAVVAYYPPVDLRLIDPSLQDALFGGPARAHPEEFALLSPSAQVRPGLPPTLILLGSADHFVFPDRVAAYDRALRAAGVAGRLVTVPYADHIFDRPFGSPGAQLTREAVARFLDGLS